MKTITIEIPDDCEVQIVKKKEKKKEKEKESTIRTYQDLIDNYTKIEGWWINAWSDIDPISSSFASLNNRNIAASEKVAKRMLAEAMISQLMPYYGGAITDEEWDDDSTFKYIIYRSKGEICSGMVRISYELLAFHTNEQKDEFLKYNERLVKDYLMID